MPAAPSPTAAPALLQEVLREAATAGRPLVQALTEDARRELGTRAEKQRDAERRDELAEAASWLLRHQHALMEQWPEAWLKRCRDDVQASTERGGREAEFRFDELELMDEDQVQERVEVARALQIAVLASESALAELNGLISAVQGFSSVQPEANPLRPQLFVDTFLELARRTGVPSGVRNLWLSGAAESLGQRLKALYGDMIRMLRRAGVQPASFMVRQQAAPAGALARGAMAGGRAAVGAGGAYAGHPGQGGYPDMGVPMQMPMQMPVPTPMPGQMPAQMPGFPPIQVVDAPLAPVGVAVPLSLGGGVPFAMGGGVPAALVAGMVAGGDSSGAGGLLTVQHLRQLVSGGPAPVADRRRSGSRPDSPQQWGRRRSDMVHDTVPAALEALENPAQLERLVERLGEGAAAGGRGFSSSEVGRRVACEVVILMLESMARDERLLLELRQELRRLEPALLALAKVDTRFFGDREHPARQLLEAITRRGLGFNDAASPAFQAFMQPLREAFGMLVSVPIEDAQPFKVALDALSEAWEEAEARGQRMRQAAVDALLHADERIRVAERLAPVLRARAVEARAPEFVVRFLAGPWALVLAHLEHERQDGADAAYTPEQASEREAIEHAAEDLLWSITRRQVRGQSSRLLRVIPDVLAALRHGLRRIDFPAADATAFFGDLVNLHRRAMRASLLAPGQPNPESLLPPAPPTPATPAQAGQALLEEAAASSSPPTEWMAPHDTGEPSVGASGDEDTVIYSPELVTEIAAADLGETPKTRPSPLLVGAWLDMFREGRAPARVQLTWHNESATMFMFSSVEGKTYTLTRRLLDRMLVEGNLQPVAGQDVLDDALDTVAKVAFQNSVLGVAPGR